MIGIDGDPLTEVTIFSVKLLVPRVFLTIIIGRLVLVLWSYYNKCIEKDTEETDVKSVPKVFYDNDGWLYFIFSSLLE